MDARRTRAKDDTQQTTTRRDGVRDAPDALGAGRDARKGLRGASYEEGRDALRPAAARAPAKPAVEPITPEEQSAIDYCESKGSNPGNIAVFEGQARGHVEKIKKESPKQFQELAEHGVSEEDMMAVAFYTSNAAYALNMVLRGAIKRPAWVSAYRPWGAKTTAALQRLPSGVRVEPAKRGAFTGVVDATLGGFKGGSKTKRKPLEKVTRKDSFYPPFVKVFRGWAVGGTMTESGFLSTTTVEGSYGGDMPVTRELRGIGNIAKELDILSLYASENEALLPPGSKFRISKITEEDPATGASQDVASPAAKYPGDGFTGKKWRIQAEAVSLPGSKKQD